MTNPALSTTTRDELVERMAALGDWWWTADVLQRRTHPRASSVLTYLIHGDEDGAVIGSIDLTDVDVALDVDPITGFIFGTFTDGGSGTGHGVVLYKEQGRSTTVASISSVDDGATAALTTAAGQVIAGSVTIVAGPGSGTVDFAIRVVPASVRRLQKAFPNTSTTWPSDAEVLTRALRAVATTHAKLREIKAAWSPVLEYFLRAGVVPLIKGGAQAVLIDEGLDQGASGNMTFNPEGILEDMRRAWAANDTGSPAPIKAGAGAHSAAEDFTDWAGGRLTGSVALGLRAFPVTLRFVCVQALSNNSGPRFAVSATPADGRRLGDDQKPSVAGVGTDPQTSGFDLVVGQEWIDELLGVEGLTVEYAPTITNEDSGTAMATTSTLWTVSGLKLNNSDAGRLWGIMTSATLARFYRTEADRDADDGVTGLVTYASGLANSTAFQSSAIDGLGLVVSGTTATLVLGHKFNVDFNPPQTAQPASAFEVTITETTTPSAWLRVVADGLFGSPYELNTGGSPNVVDSWLKRASPVGGRHFGDME